MTVFKGRVSPSILEYKAFPGRRVKAGKYHAWPLSSNYMKGEIPKSARDYMENFDTRAYLVIQNDSIVYEEYWDGFSDTTWSNSFSMAKSLVSLCIGKALEEGLIESLDDPMSKYLDLYNEEGKDRVTIRQMLTMSSGMNYSESYLNPFGYAAKANYGTDLQKLISNYEVDEEPGKIFKYQSGDSQSLAFLIKAVSGKSLSEYFSERIWSQIGASRDALWSLDREGGDEKAFCCFNSNARDFARIGKLMLHKGRWNGNSILDSTYVEMATRPAPLKEKDGADNKRYGYQWWMGEFSGRQVFYARGINGQYIFCIPEEDMVVVRLGFKRSRTRIDGHPEDSFKYIETALMLCGEEI